MCTWTRCSPFAMSGGTPCSAEMQPSASSPPLPQALAVPWQARRRRAGRKFEVLVEEDSAMTLIFKHQRCPGCGQRHHFGLADGQPEEGQHYEFVCPMTGQRTSLHVTEPAEPAQFWPQGA